jgi:hypothetical protein
MEKSTEAKAKATRNIMVTFGRDVTEEDLKQLQNTTDVIAALRAPVDVDQDHVHGAQ